ncbi:Protein cms1 [Taxawa tesnikishii (nom. ined.)]|nr:Protein cms1 [Dothideales sp. JES 119]
MSDSEDQGAGVPLLEPLSPSPELQTSGKRKRNADGKPESKRAAKRKKTKKPKDIEDDALDVEAGLNHAIAQMDSQLMADHIAQRTGRFQSDLSTMELDELRIPASAIMDTTGWDKPRNLENLPSFLERYSRSKRGRARTSSPMHMRERTAAHTRGSWCRTKEAMVAKLFAKHIKLREQADMVKKSRISIGVGTPQRITDLLEDGALGQSGLERIVIDASHIDQKKRGILDMKEIEVPLVRLLSREDLRSKYGAGEGKVELLFY